MSPNQDAGARFQSEARHSVELETTFHLIERARAGDQEALERLFARHLKPLQRWARGRLPKWARDLADTDDLVQETSCGGKDVNRMPRILMASKSRVSNHPSSRRSVRRLLSAMRVRYSG
jgi:hypothetical protein